jgi:hypothetical protein
MQGKEDGRDEMPDNRNYKMDTVCTICNTPFDPENEGYDGEINNVPAKLCSACYEGVENVVEASVPHTFIECPNCSASIGLRVETSE